MLSGSWKRGLILGLLSASAACSPHQAPAETHVSAVDSHRVADLFSACAQGDKSQVVRIVESQGPDIVNFQLPSLATPLQRAVEFRQFAIAEYLLSKGAQANLTSGKENDTPILHAAYLGDSKMVELLLKNGADPNRQESRFGHTPLTYAAWKGHAETVQLLLDAGADVGMKNKQGQDARRIAVIHRHNEIVEKIDRKKSAEAERSGQ